MLSDPGPEYDFFDWSWSYCDTNFDDYASISIINAVADTSSGQSSYGCIIGTYRPEEPLSRFEGEDSNGIWTLQIDDPVWMDTGTLNSWSITLE